MLELLVSPEAWAAFVTLSVMEIVLGIDNIIFISIIVGKLPEPAATRARQIGLLLALVFRVALLFAITWIIGLTVPVFTLPFEIPSADGHSLFDPAISWRDIILIAGGLFLMVKGTREIHGEIEHEEKALGHAVSASFAVLIAQIVVIDMVFSVDSILTAVGMADDVEVMIAAVILAIGVMYVASGPIAGFVKRNPTTKMLALAFLLLIGVALIADGLGFHIPRGYIYFSMAFAAVVEVFNVLAKRRKQKLSLRSVMVKAIVVHEVGGPDVLKWEDVTVKDPGPGEARVKHAAVGLNFVDVYNRTGLYKQAGGLPFTPGAEGAGTVVAVGSGVTHVKPGDRVTYQGPQGSYSEERLIPADRLIKIPDAIDFKTAAAMTLKGLTVQYLLRQTFPVKKGQTILFHAAAGGVGLIAGQWANHLGATVIGTVGSDDKAALAKAHGYHHVINYKTENFVERVAEITGGKKCDVVYDSVGRDTYPGSLDCLKPLGMWVLFGQSSGVIQNFELNILAQKGSLYVSRPTLVTYTAKREDLERMAAELIDVVTKGIVKIEVKQEFPLAKAADAHRALEGRQTSGATVMLP